MLAALLRGLALSRAAMRAKLTAQGAVHRIAMMAALYSAACALLLMGWVFVLGGAFALTAHYLGYVPAAFTFGAFFLVIGGTVLAVIRVKFARPPKRAEATEAAAAEAAKMPHPPESFADEVRETVREHAVPLTVAALAAGLAAGAGAARRRKRSRGNGRAEPGAD